MHEPNQLHDGLSQAAWGYFFVTFDFNLGTVSILPRFVGFLLLLSAIGKLSGLRRDLALLRPLCMLLACYSFGDWFLSWSGRDIDGMIPFLDLVVAVAMLYFHFQFLTDMAALAQEFQLDDDNLPARMRSHRTDYTLLVTCISLGVVAGRDGLCGRHYLHCGPADYGGPVPSAQAGAQDGDWTAIALALVALL